MKPLTVNFLLLLACLGALVGHVQAQSIPPTTFDSIEWDTVDSDVIVKGHVTLVDRSNGVTISFHVDETLKGPMQQDLKFRAASGWPPRPGKRWDNKGSLLVFLVESRRIGANVMLTDGRRALSQYRYTPRWSRSDWGLEPGESSFVPVEPGSKLDVLGADGEKINDPSLILYRIKETLTETATGIWVEGKVDVPRGRHIVVPKKLENPPLITSWGDNQPARFGSASAYDGARILSGRGSNAVLWDAKTGKVLKTIPGRAGDVQSVNFSPDGTQVVVGAAATPPKFDGAITLWDLASGRRVGEYGLPRSGVSGIDFESRNGRLLTTCASYGSTGALQTLWNIFSREAEFVFPGNQVTFSDDSTMIASHGEMNAAIFDSKSFSQLASLKGSAPEENTFRSIKFAPYGNRVVTTSVDGIAIWEAETGRLIANRHIMRLSNAIYTPDGDTILVATQDSRVEVVDPQTLERLRDIKTPKKPYAMVLSKDGKHLLVEWGSSFFINNHPEGASLLDVATGRQILRIDGPVTELIGFSPDSKTICSLSPGTGGKEPSYDLTTRRMSVPERIINEATIWDAETGAVLRHIRLP